MSWRVAQKIWLQLSSSPATTLRTLQLDEIYKRLFSQSSTVLSKREHRLDSCICSLRHNLNTAKNTKNVITIILIVSYTLSTYLFIYLLIINSRGNSLRAKNENNNKKLPLLTVPTKESRTVAESWLIFTVISIPVLVKRTGNMFGKEGNSGNHRRRCSESVWQGGNCREDWLAPSPLTLLRYCLCNLRHNTIDRKWLRSLVRYPGSRGDNVLPSPTTFSAVEVS